jgi:hypothetical protein
MNVPPTPEAAGGPADLDSTRRRFLFAREQIAAQRSSKSYFAVRDMRRRAAERAFSEPADAASH